MPKDSTVSEQTVYFNTAMVCLRTHHEPHVNYVFINDHGVCAEWNHFHSKVKVSPSSMHVSKGQCLRPPLFRKNPSWFL